MNSPCASSPYSTSEHRKHILHSPVCATIYSDNADELTTLLVIILIFSLWTISSLCFFCCSDLYLILNICDLFPYFKRGLLNADLSMHHEISSWGSLLRISICDSIIWRHFDADNVLLSSGKGNKEKPESEDISGVTLK